jgi:hypothetical protein
MGKVVHFPVTTSQRIRNERGPLYVPCQVSERWIQFPEQSSGPYEGGEFIFIDIMTNGSNDKPRKLCDLVVTREDLLEALENVKTPEPKQ